MTGRHASIAMTGRLPNETAATVTPRIAAAATGQGFKAAAPVPGTLMLTRSFRPDWSKIAGGTIILLAVGLAALNVGPVSWLIVFVGVACIVFVKTSETVALVIVDAVAGVDITATGAANAELLGFVTHLVPDWETHAPVTSARARLPGRLALVAVLVIMVVAGAIAAVASRGDEAPVSDFDVIARLTGSYENLYCETHEALAFPDGPARTVYRCGHGVAGPCFTVSGGAATRVDDFPRASRLGCTRAS